MVVFLLLSVPTVYSSSPFDNKAAAISAASSSSSSSSSACTLSEEITGTFSSSWLNLARVFLSSAKLEVLLTAVVITHFWTT
jgi:hypothetical protein